MKTAIVSINELPQAEWNVAHQPAAALAYLMRHVLRYILRPPFSGVESDDLDRVLIFA
jgi:hypothetical protein